jgi:hypothetical protein
MSAHSSTNAVIAKAKPNGYGNYWNINSVRPPNGFNAT